MQYRSHRCLFLQVVHFIPTASYHPRGRYECPVFVAGVRKGQVTAMGRSTNFIHVAALPVVERGEASAAEIQAWVLRGAALVCESAPE